MGVDLVFYVEKIFYHWKTIENDLDDVCVIARVRHDNYYCNDRTFVNRGVTRH